VTRMLATINRKDCHERPPDWRWQRVGELQAAGERIRKSSDHDNLSQLNRFRRRLNRANSQSDMNALLASYPALYTAWTIYDNPAREKKGELEARILSQEPFDLIAAKLNLSEEAVAAYEMYFFNVTDLLSAPGYVTHQIFGKAVHAGLAEHQYDLLWKMYGYWCGPMVLDAMIYKFNGPPRPESTESVSALWIDDVSEVVRMNTAILMRQRPTDWERQVEVGNMFLRMLELERNASGGGGIGQEAILENVNAMMERLPWQKYDLGVQNIADATDDIEAIEMLGFGLRSHELAAISIGNVPNELRHMIDSAVYPKLEDEDEQNNPEAN